MDLASAPGSTRWSTILWWFLAGVMALACFLSMAMAWRAQRQVGVLEQELVRRQEASQNQALEAQMLSKQASEVVRESAAKVALLEARVSEVALQRTQLEELVQSLSRSRDENLVSDIESGIRVAIQQAAITGSSEPLVAVLRQSDERLVRNNQPRLQGVRRAILRDLDRVRAAGSVDVAVLTIRLDEAVRLMDDLPLLSALKLADDLPGAETKAEAVTPPSASASAPAGGSESSWWENSRALGRRVWGEVKSLVRVSRIDQPDAVLMAPEQSFFLRENLKLRLLNARLALLSRQFDTAQADLKVVQDALSRYFDPQSRRTSHATEVVRQVAAQARAVSVPRPDDTLAALAAAEAGR
jgi:uroporphyrin-3 C-methyltransferase